jgi:hypothetical protein
MECFKTNWWCVLGDPSSLVNFTLQCKFSLAQVQVKYNSLLLVLALIYILIITIDMELLWEVCERLYICWYLDLLFQSNSFRLLFSFCSSVFLFLGYLLGRYLHFPLPIIVTFLTRTLWCMCYLLRFRFRFCFLCFLRGLLYSWDCDWWLRFFLSVLPFPVFAFLFYWFELLSDQLCVLYKLLICFYSSSEALSPLSVQFFMLSWFASPLLFLGFLKIYFILCIFLIASSLCFGFLVGSMCLSTCSIAVAGVFSWNSLPSLCY